MDGIINGIELTVVKEYEYYNIIIQNIDSITNKRYRDCYYKYFHTFSYECVYDINFRNKTNNEIVTLTFSARNLGMYEINKKLTLAKQRGFIFKQINKLTIKIYSNLFYINIHYHLRLGASPLHYQFAKNLLKNPDYIETHCNNVHNPFHFACRQWYKYNNPSILT